MTDHNDPLLRILVEGFVEEAAELVEKITAELLALEKATAGSPALAKSYTSLARALHTIKGSGTTIGLEDVSQLAHAMEDVVAPHQRAQEPFPRPIADAILVCLDEVQGRVRDHAAGRGKSLPDPGLAIAALHASLGEAHPAPSAAAIVPAPGPSLPEHVFPAAATVAPPAPPPAPAPTPPAPTAPPIAANPPATVRSADVAPDEAGWRVGLRQLTPLFDEVERLREMRLRALEARREIDRAITLLAAAMPGPSSSTLKALLGTVARTVSTDADLTGEVIGALEETIKSICTLPVRSILDPLQRTVRDLCRGTGKEARLSIVGAEVSLDRRALEALKGPIVHLIRNAVDHGVEVPAERERHGKHREGALVIRVEQQGNSVFIEISDDGNGIDLARVRAVAFERGLLSADQAARMEPGELRQLIFRPGFSTRAQVSETSGRGVGMDVVDTEVRALGGHVEVESKPGQGTRFILTVPAGLGSTPLLVLRCGEHSFAIPTMAVPAIAAAKSGRVRAGSQQMRFEYEERLIPLLDLGAVMGLRQSLLPREGQPVLVVSAQGRIVALAVDEVSGDRDAAVQPLPSEVQKLPAYLGACVQARGDLVLVLRPDWLVATGAGAHAPVQKPRQALVVDDSLTARAMHRTSLEAGGYTVHTASNARHGLDQLRQTGYDVIICDIGMPDMDGIEFTAEVRRQPRINATPILLVSALEDPAECARGLAAGADAFLSKKDCMSGRLLAAVAQVVNQRAKVA
jgi:two-component system, chemotaxis family, sensor kinase CheA